MLFKNYSDTKQHDTIFMNAVLILIICTYSSLMAIPTIVIAYDQPTPDAPQAVQSTAYIAKEIKQALTKNGNLQVILVAHKPNTSFSYQATSLANRLKADLFIYLSVVYQELVRPTITPCYRQLDTLITSNTLIQKAEFVSIEKSYQSCLYATQRYATQLHTMLSRPTYQKFIRAQSPIGLPIKPLQGLIVPGLLLELAISNYTSPKTVIPAISQSIYDLICSY